jgi:hypothetical protein
MCGSQIFLAIFTKFHNCGVMCKDIFTVKVVKNPCNFQCEKLPFVL